MSNPNFLAGQTLSSETLQLLGKLDTSWVPTLEASVTNPDLGTAPVQQSEIHRNGLRVDLWFRITFGTTPAAGNGIYQIPLPAAYPLRPGSFNYSFGTAHLTDAAAGFLTGFVGIDEATDLMTIRVSGNYSLLTEANPWAWAAGYTIAGHASYLADIAT